MAGPFVKLNKNSTANDAFVYVNANNVLYIEPASQRTTSIIFKAGGADSRRETVVVNESAEQVADMMNAALS